MSDGFDKYARRGAYHWDFLSSNPWRHHCPTTARYRAVIDAWDGWRGARVVDIGCGDGALAGLLVRAGAEVTGVEPDPHGLALAKQAFTARQLPGTFVADMAQLEPERFDAAVCAEVIEHVADPEGLLRRIATLLKPGGVVIVTTPIRLTEDPLDPHHVRELFPGEFRALMETPFVEVRLERHIPLAGLMLYYWRPWFFLRRPLIARICNLLDSGLGINPVAGINALDRYHLMQLAVGAKPHGRVKHG